jgi:hypothetical protein
MAYHCQLCTISYLFWIRQYLSSTGIYVETLRDTVRRAETRRSTLTLVFPSLLHQHGADPDH